MKYIMAIDQGTSSSRAIIFNEQAEVCGVGQYEFEQYYPNNGWVEHDAEAIWQTVLKSGVSALQQAGLQASEIACIGITNQRETTVLWNKKTGEPVYHAIVWQDRRSTEHCERLLQDNLEALITDKTGLLIDPYFSATKIAWILENVPEAKTLAEQGNLAFGTIDSFILWRLTGGIHKTEPSNASRTMLYNINSHAWDDELLKIFSIPKSLLPEVVDSNAHFGDCLAEHFGARIPITGILGDQQAATVGQACIHPGMVKSTYGTGCFALLNMGKTYQASSHRLLNTIAYQINGETIYGLEGSIFNAGTTIKWLRDSLGLIEHPRQAQTMAESLNNNGGIYMVPAFTGLGAPHWDANARGAILGLQRSTRKEHLVRAALEAVCYQTHDLLTCMPMGTHQRNAIIRVDGGMAANDWLMQFLADTLNLTVERPEIIETTAFGAAFMAGLGARVYASLEEIETLWHSQKKFSPDMDDALRQQNINGWQRALRRVLNE